MWQCNGGLCSPGTKWHLLLCGRARCLKSVSVVRYRKCHLRRVWVAKIILFQHPWHGQGHLSLELVIQCPIQPSGDWASQLLWAACSSTSAPSQLGQAAPGRILWRELRVFQGLQKIHLFTDWERRRYKIEKFHNIFCFRIFLWI